MADPTENINEVLLDPLFPPGVAERFIEYSLPEAAEARLAVLREKANEGLLTAAEQGEYEEFIENLDLIGIMRVTAQAAQNRRAS